MTASWHRAAAEVAKGVIGAGEFGGTARSGASEVLRRLLMAKTWTRALGLAVHETQLANSEWAGASRWGGAEGICWARRRAAATGRAGGARGPAGAPQGGQPCPSCQLMPLIPSTLPVHFFWVIKMHAEVRRGGNAPLRGWRGQHNSKRERRC